MNELNPINAILNQIPLFKEMTPESQALVAEKITLEYFPANHLIFKQGDVGDSMYILKNGKVKIYQGDDEMPDAQTIIAEIENNGFFGEMALVSEQTRNANAKTEVDCEVFVLKKEEFYKLVNDNPSLMKQIGVEFISRIKENMRNDEFAE